MNFTSPVALPEFWTRPKVNPTLGTDDNGLWVRIAGVKVRYETLTPADVTPDDDGEFAGDSDSLSENCRSFIRENGYYPPPDVGPGNDYASNLLTSALHVIFARLAHPDVKDEAWRKVSLKVPGNGWPQIRLAETILLEGTLGILRGYSSGELTLAQAAAFSIGAAARSERGATSRAQECLARQNYLARQTTEQRLSYADEAARIARLYPKAERGLRGEILAAEEWRAKIVSAKRRAAHLGYSFEERDRWLRVLANEQGDVAICTLADPQKYQVGSPTKLREVLTVRGGRRLKDAIKMAALWNEGNEWLLGGERFVVSTALALVNSGGRKAAIAAVARALKDARGDADIHPSAEEAAAVKAVQALDATCHAPHSDAPRPDINTPKVELPDLVAPPEGAEHVYVMGYADNSFVKVGYSDNVLRRKGEVQRGQPHPVRILHAIRGGQPEEAELHRRLAHLRAEGEWFNNRNGEVLEAFGIRSIN